MCKEKPETARHIVSACPKLAQEEYKKRHDKVALRIHWELAKKHNIEHAEKWYDHIPAAVAETDTIQLKWDSTIYTNNRLAHNRPDITLIDKKSNEWTLIDIAVPMSVQNATSACKGFRLFTTGVFRLFTTDVFKLLTTGVF